MGRLSLPVLSSPWDEGKEILEEEGEEKILGRVEGDGGRGRGRNIMGESGGRWWGGRVRKDAREGEREMVGEEWEGRL